jgi:Protein of unknown function (DUF3606)
MSDDLSKRGPADRDRINLKETWEVNWWCEHLGVTPQQLRGAVAKVGVMARDVRESLGK